MRSQCVPGSQNKIESLGTRLAMLLPHTYQPKKIFLQDKLPDFSGFCSFLQDTPPPPPRPTCSARPLSQLSVPFIISCTRCFTSCTPPEAMEKSSPHKDCMCKWSTHLALLHDILLPILLPLTSFPAWSSWQLEGDYHGRTWSFTKESLGKTTST